MKKLLGVIIVLLVLLPLIPRLIPQEKTFDTFQAAMEKKGFSIANVKEIKPPQQGAIAERELTINDIRVEFFRFDDEGKIATQYEYNKPDAGSAIVEAWNLSEKLGAAKPAERSYYPARNGMLLLIVYTEDKALRMQIVKAFESI